MGRTLAEKVWEQHLVRKGEGSEPDLLYIDLHLVHEVTSPQAFDGLRLAGRRGPEDPDGLVQHTDTAMLSHSTILTSRNVGSLVSADGVPCSGPVVRGVRDGR